MPQAATCTDACSGCPCTVLACLLVCLEDKALIVTRQPAPSVAARTGASMISSMYCKTPPLQLGSIQRCLDTLNTYNNIIQLTRLCCTGRWLRDPAVMDDYTNFWISERASPQAYTSWLASAVLAGCAPLPCTSLHYKQQILRAYDHSLQADEEAAAAVHVCYSNSMGFRCQSGLIAGAAVEQAPR